MTDLQRQDDDGHFVRLSREFRWLFNGLSLSQRKVHPKEMANAVI